MRSEGYCSWSVCTCVSVIQNLTYRPTNDTTYLTGNEGQNNCAVFSENAPLQSWSDSCIVRLFASRPFLMKTRMRIILERSATKLTTGNHAEGFALQCFSLLLLLLLLLLLYNTPPEGAV